MKIDGEAPMAIYAYTFFLSQMEKLHATPMMVAMRQTEVLTSLLQVLEVGDEADELGPHGGERRCGTLSSEREREQQRKGSFVFSQCIAMLAP